MRAVGQALSYALTWVIYFNLRYRPLYFAKQYTCFLSPWAEIIRNHTFTGKVQLDLHLLERSATKLWVGVVQKICIPWRIAPLHVPPGKLWKSTTHIIVSGESLERLNLSFLLSLTQYLLRLCWTSTYILQKPRWHGYMMLWKGTELLGESWCRLHSLLLTHLWWAVSANMSVVSGTSPAG